MPELRPRLAHSLGRKSEYPHLVVRMGFGPNLEPAPRRPIEDVLIG